MSEQSEQIDINHLSNWKVEDTLFISEKEWCFLWKDWKKKIVLSFRVKKTFAFRVKKAFPFSQIQLLRSYFSSSLTVAGEQGAHISRKPIKTSALNNE